MTVEAQDFRVPEGAPVDLTRWSTRVDPAYDSKKHYQKQLRKRVSRLSKLQYRLYAARTNALLLIFQGMDTSGKDSTIRRVMSGVNPQGCAVYSFKQPSAEELAHDFLWRTTERLPERGKIGVFNRSYYEEVLVVRVHPEILERQGLPETVANDPLIWQDRYRSIIEHERHLTRNGTRVLKFYLHISAEEQARRFIARLEDPKKRWKFSTGDINERAYWDDYMRAYEQCLATTSTDEAPWYVIPADDKKNAQLIVSRIILDHMEELDPRIPGLSETQRQEIEALAKKLMEEQPSFVVAAESESVPALNAGDSPEA